MTTLFRDSAICPVCGTELFYSSIGSTNTFGSMDLDTRPPEMERSTISHWLIECHECGYVSVDMAKPALVDKSFLSQEGYKTCDGYDFISNLTEGFYRYHLINKANGNYKAAAFALIHAAWTCDDAQDAKAPELRAKAVELLDSNPDDYNEGLYIMRADLLRRSFQYDKVIDDYENKAFSQSLLNDIAKYQVKLAREKDAGCYTVSSAVEYAKRLC